MSTIHDTDSIHSVILVKIKLDYYKQNPGDSPIAKDLCFSDGGARQYVYSGSTYLGMGSLMGITSSASELKSTSSDLTITLSGIPNTSLYEIINSRLKGSYVEIVRAYYDSTTMNPLDVRVNPTGPIQNTTSRFIGFVNNYSLQEEYDIESKTASNTIAITCTSSIDIIANKYGGRKTNPTSQNKYFPNDVSMNRVPNLENASYNFGMKVK
jgi:hypothetical protein